MTTPPGPPGPSHSSSASDAPDTEAPAARMRTEHARIPYDGLRGHDGPYLADPGLIDAANVALGLGLPLLLTGEPGCGKTDFAHVAAHALTAHALAGTEPGTRAHLDGPDSRTDGPQDLDAGPDPDEDDAAVSDPGKPLVCQIRSDSRARDLLYHYDALLRFTDGQHGGPQGAERAEDARHYVELQALGIALTASTRRVVLLDEIDKAPRDLPNDLLRELHRGVFEIAEIGARRKPGARPVPVHDHRTGVPLRRRMQRPPGAPMPLVIITSNVERQLPDPFLRRCVFYHIPFPRPRRLAEILRARRDAHDPTLTDRLVRIFLSAREIEDLVKKPSTAELLDWVAGLALFEPGDIRLRVTSFAAALGERGRVQRPDLRWTDLPAVGCLFKLHDDLNTARRATAGPAPAQPGIGLTEGGPA